MLGMRQNQGEGNKWLAVSYNPSVPSLLILTPGSLSDAQDICSDACLQKLISDICQRIRNEATESATQ